MTNLNLIYHSRTETLVMPQENRDIFIFPMDKTKVVLKLTPSNTCLLVRCSWETSGTSDTSAKLVNFTGAGLLVRHWTIGLLL